ncbi:MAG: mechanosensitive ion channel [Thermoanaerobaculia bacterium]|nr:mechanosensitive ion channel [Thermoanaerobaculia bacterium]
MTEIGHPPPYSLTELDRLLDQVDALEIQRESLAAALSSDRDTLRDLTEISKEAGQERRRQQESGPPEAIAQAVLESELAEERRLLAVEESESTAREMDILERDLESAREKVADVEGQISPLRTELRGILDEIASERLAAEKTLENDRRSLERAEEKWARRAPEVSDPLTVANGEPGPEWWALELARQKVRLGKSTIDRLARRSLVWEQRFSLYDPSITVSQRTAIEEAAAEASRELHREAAQLRSQSVAFRGRLVAAPDTLRAPLKTLMDLLDESSSSVEASLRLEERLSRQLQRASETSGLEDRVSRWQHRLRSVWLAEIVVIDDRPVTVGKVVVALILSILGFLAAKLAAGWLGRGILPRLGLDSGASATFQTLAFYLLLVGFLLTALRIMNIPLTAFTVLGGVLAIGVGFGSQNVVGNFISGLILMAERPMKVGDIVELEATHGRVERIGARSTRISTSDGTHLIVPNSTLLEQNVVNWTLSDTVIRGKVEVGVSYGSSTRGTAKALEEAMTDAPRVLRHPKPEVRLTEFGDNAIVFEGLFWVRIVEPADRRRAESEVRHRIDESLRKAGIVIAFPQRDLHLDSVRPLDIRLVEGSVASPTEGNTIVDESEGGVDGA